MAASLAVADETQKKKRSTLSHERKKLIDPLKLDEFKWADYSKTASVFFLF